MQKDVLWKQSTKNFIIKCINYLLVCIAVGAMFYKYISVTSVAKKDVCLNWNTNFFFDVQLSSACAFILQLALYALHSSFNKHVQV